ncbi:MAG: hypothetical protein PVJ92_02480 [Candidatus Dependentiae bacterium]|jgi:lipopolysaccharide assembly outer membrane protein LptD (OstA)
MKYFVLFLSGVLSAHTVSITSDHAQGQRSSTGYFFTYTENVTAHSSTLGYLRADLLTAHFVQRGTTTCDYLLARNVTIRQKERILFANRAVYNTRTHRITAQGNVRVMGKPNVTTNAHTAVLDLQTHQLHLNHGTHTHAFTRTSS